MEPSIGVCFLSGDEAAEFPAKALEALRTPLERGEVCLGRSELTARYPAEFQLVLAANPCPCGNHATPGMECRCAPAAVRRYRDRISGPILDRIDIHQQLIPLKRSLIRPALEQVEPSSAVAGRVREARERQQRRLVGTPWRTNGEVPGPYLRTELPLPEGIGLLDEAVGRGRLSARGVDKCLRLCWTLADLGGRDRPVRDDIRLAIALRRGEPASVGALR